MDTIARFKSHFPIITVLIAIGFTSILLEGCKADDNTISIVTSPSSSSACRGRKSGVKAGPTDLNLPYPGGVSHTVTQTWFGAYSHYFIGGEYALDFTMSEGTVIYPVAAGRVMDLKEDSDTTCSTTCDQANYVLIDHGNQVYGRYFHMCKDCVDVVAGQDISSDTPIARAGNTGWSIASHLHFELVDWEENCTVTYGFVENGGAATALTQGTSYTSANSGTDTFFDQSVIRSNTYENVGVELTSSI